MYQLHLYVYSGAPRIPPGRSRICCLWLVGMCLSVGWLVNPLVSLFVCLLVGCCGGLFCAWLESMLVCVVCVYIRILFMRCVIVWGVVWELAGPKSVRDESESRQRGARGVLEQTPEKLSKKSPIRRFGIRRPAARNTEK